MFVDSCLIPIELKLVMHYSMQMCCGIVVQITDSKAKELGLHAVKSLTVEGGVQRPMKSKRYKVPLVDLKGHKFIIEVHSINIISSDMKGLNFSEIKKYFPEAKGSQLIRPKGKVDNLIGYNYAAWHPTPEKAYEHLLISSNSFGKCVGGNHPDMCEKTENISFIVNFISTKNVITKFSIVEALGTEFSPMCGKCKCGNCTLGGNNCTIREEKELALINKYLEFCKEGYWIAGYPWVKDAANLLNNNCHADRLLIQAEKRLKNDSFYERSYCNQMQDMLSRNVARKLTEDDISTSNGPILYSQSRSIKTNFKNNPSSHSIQFQC